MPGASSIETDERISLDFTIYAPDGASTDYIGWISEEKPETGEYIAFPAPNGGTFYLTAPVIEAAP